MLHDDGLPVPAGGATAPISPVDQRPVRRSLLDLVEALGKADEDLVAPDFDPEEVVGALREKVDGVHFVIERMAAVAEWLRNIAGPLERRAKALDNNRNRLRDYVTECLRVERAARQETGEDVTQVGLSGNSFRVRLRESPPALKIDREATPMDFQGFPEFVTQERRYVWDQAKIRAALKAGTLPQGIPARFTQGYWPEFVPAVPEKLEPRGKGKKS